MTSLLSLLESHHSDFEEERLFIKMALAFAEQHPASCCDRHFETGHFTASAWVLNPAKDATLLIHHRGLGKWLQPGGHIEADDVSLQEAARRELKEECGIQDAVALSDALFDLDIHIIPAKGAVSEHVHYDLRFAFIVAEDVGLSPDFSEIKDLKWCTWKELLATPLQQSIRRMILKNF